MNPNDMADALTEILRAASKHPNSRVSKLIHTVQEEPSQKNIVLLLIELAEHAEYSTDFNVSLKYYLDFFERLGISSDLVLNEAGLLLVNSSKIYSKRVDYVQSLVERQILTLSNADEELQKQKLEQQQTENAAPTEKPKRGRKRVLEAPSDPYEVELSPKKFKKLTAEKRFAVPKSAQKAKSLLRNIEMEQQIHPAGWLHATIYDLENEEDVDTKRNYKLFTYHIEHRYNTLVPDINFRLHFKMKDYMDEQEEMEDEACNTDRSWPPLSEAYVQKYLRLENYVLQQDLKANKRKAAELDEDLLSSSESQTVLTNDPKDPAEHLDINDSINGKNASELDQTMLDCSEANNCSNVDLDPANKSDENLDSSNINGKNDSGLGQSILDETNSTLETTQLDSTNAENLNDTNSAEANKENDSALDTSVLDQTSTTENNTTAESAGDLDKTTNSENLNDTNIADANNSLNTTANQQENDSALGTSVLDQSNDATTEGLNDTNVEAEANKSFNNTETQLENDSALGTSVLDQTSNTENNTTTEENESLNTTQEGLGESTAETNGVLDSSSTENENLETIKEGDDAELSKATENRKDSALTDDRHYSISTENLAMSTENLNKIDVEQQQDKDNNQIHIELPHTDDEGVYLSDLEDNECRLLSPVIKAANILPGVERKDVTIYMDDELREALEMRDDIMEHFSYETFKVPVITTPKKQNLLFNIFKLPEKLVRRKILFKLGPEMDLYLQARSLKRCRPETAARVVRTPQLSQWFSLNDTDMSGVCMSPPYSPGHSSDFCGFSDNEDDDDDDSHSCADFCGFTEEEQETLIIKHVCRLSRDSGVGVDVNNLTPEKETLEIIFEEGVTSAVENCKRIINLDETPNNCGQSTENLLNQLPDEIRDVLTTELEGNNETPDNGNNEPNTETICGEAIEDTEKLQTQSSMDNSECISTENASTNNTQESDMVLTENSTETQICTEESAQSTEPLTNAQETNTETQNCTEESALSTETSNMVLTEKSTEPATCSEECPESTEVESQEKAAEGVTESEIQKDSDIERPCNKSSNSDESKKSDEELLKEKLDFANSMAETDNDDIMENDDDSEDDEMLDLDTQGIKTKIQQWHEHLQPILAKSRERHHFDVFKLGSEIIETVQSKPDSNEESVNVSKSSSTSSNRPAASFHDVMDSKDNSYVSRYFLSTLLLANQSNIEITIDNKSSEKPSSWHDIHLKLLSTKRHTVAIEDNIGMIVNKQKNSDNKAKLKTKETPIMEKTQEVVDEEEDEPLIKLQSSKKSPKKSKTSLKRNSANAITSLIAEKKPKEITTTTPTISRHNELPHLMEDVQIITPPVAVSDMNMMPCTSRQAQNINTALFNININTIQTLQPIEKKLANQNISKYFRKIKNLPVLAKLSL